MPAMRSDEPLPELPAAIEAQASEILLGPPDLVASGFEALCAANEPLRPALMQLRTDFQRAAHLLYETGDSPLPVPPSIGPYRFLRQIGEGAFGAVFLAEQQEPIRREVAVKLLHSPASSGTAISRFLIERETLARMSHPAIARIFDAGVDAHGRPYFVMEYVAGEPLHRFVAKRAADLTARITLFLAACEGVHHAHQRGVIHRDLKPQNILVADIDGKWQPKVIDFGLAKVVEQEIGNAVLTQAGVVLGTPAYMSPEQVCGDPHSVDMRTDVYALGVILYELLTTTLPVSAEACRGKSMLQLQQLILETEAPRASVRAAEAGMPYARALRGDLDWILRKALQKREGERYASVAEFAADLRHFLAHEPVSAGPPSPGYALRKFVRRNRVAVTAGTMVFAALLIGLLVSAASLRRADADAERARQRLEDFWRLADVVELEELLAAEQDLWPALPERLADHERWLLRANGLVERRDLCARTVATLRQRLAAPDAPVGDEARGASFLLESLERHLAGLDAFAAATGILPAVARRAAHARTVQARSIDEQRVAWDQAIARVAKSPLYDGLALQPMLGLVPLGPDLDSGLEEFAHLQSGRVPHRDASGALSIGDDTCIVLVLMRGGEFQIGSQSANPIDPNYDPYRDPLENELATVRLEPYLLAKYELTQGQVQALGMPISAIARMGTRQAIGPEFTGRHPEESIATSMVQTWLPRFGLRLPNAAEWEVAARGGTTTPWSFGTEPACLQGHANVADATMAAVVGTDVETDRSLNDGWLSHAPVGSYLPNAFGLHDILGNISEMTTAPATDGTTLFFSRGGSFLLPPARCRVASARLVTGSQTTVELGLRVCCDVPQQ